MLAVVGDRCELRDAGDKAMASSIGYRTALGVGAILLGLAFAVTQAFAVEEIDPTGAGDCFGAAYLTSRRAGLPPARALLYANAAGARTVTRRGPMEGVSSRQELDRFIAAAGREVEA